MTHQGGNVESPCPFRSVSLHKSGSYFLGTPANSALAWVTASQKISSTFSLDRPTTSIFGAPASSRRTTLASGSASPVHHSWRMAKSSNRSPSSVCRSMLRRLADRHARPPLRPPVRAVVGGRRGTDLPFLHLNRLNRGNAVVVLGELVCLFAVEVDPFDAVALAATRRHHVHRRHRRPPFPLVGSSLTAPDHHVRQTTATSRQATDGNRCRRVLPSVIHCEGDHCGNSFLIMDILASNF